ncbi:hypothetical protein Syun_022993 [Stephania yunnanensis]|uniref:Uncharacterized protein n=1 Tax=Stephania yunnanensis TaxID=152371 RepID=A0AAP0FGB4_9MAGN
MVTRDSSIPDLCPRILVITLYLPSPPGHPYPYQHGTPSPSVQTLPPQHGFIPSSSHHFTPTPPANVYPHDHGIRSSSSHNTTPSPLGHPAHSPRVGDEHTSTSRQPPSPHRHSFTRSPSSRLWSSIPQPLEEIPDFFIPPTAPTDGENLLIYLIAEHGLYVFFTWDLPISFAIYDAWCRRVAIRYTGNIYLITKKIIALVYLTEEVFEHYKRMRATDEAFKKKSEHMSSNRKSEHNLFTTNDTIASASQPLPTMPSMMDCSQLIPRISPKSRAKIPVVRRRGGGRGGVIEIGG